MGAATTNWGTSDQGDIKQIGAHLGSPPDPAPYLSAERMPAPEAFLTVREGKFMWQPLGSKRQKRMRGIQIRFIS